jgi:hypothetical protein
LSAHTPCNKIHSKSAKIAGNAKFNSRDSVSIIQWPRQHHFLLTTFIHHQLMMIYQGLFVLLFSAVAQVFAFNTDGCL